MKDAIRPLNRFKHIIECICVLSYVAAFGLMMRNVQFAVMACSLACLACIYTAARRWISGVKWRGAVVGAADGALAAWMVYPPIPAIVVYWAVAGYVVQRFCPCRMAYTIGVGVSGTIVTLSLLVGIASRVNPQGYVGEFFWIHVGVFSTIGFLIGDAECDRMACGNNAKSKSSAQTGPNSLGNG